MRKVFQVIGFPMLLSAMLLAGSSLLAPSIVRAGGQDTPFPLDFPLPFPWGTIEGTWSVDTEDFAATFVFEVARASDNRQILRVTQFDPETDSVVAQGIGYKTDSATTVYAAMSSKLGSTYWLIVGAYREKRGVEMKRFHGLRIFRFDSGKEERYRIQKLSGELPFDVSRSPKPECSALW